MEERTRKIIETAMTLAEKGGFEAVRLRDVASQSGVAIGTFYKRFKSKEDLLVAALDLEVSRMERRMQQAPGEGGSPEERVAFFFDAATKRLARKPMLARAVLKAVASGEPSLAEKVARFHDRTANMIVHALWGDGKSNGAMGHSEEERQVAFILEQVWFTSLVGWTGGLHSKEEVIEHVRQAAKLLLRGMGTH
ncbi:MAG: TetR family transcriptional regulator [Myxococcales bacterium]|nr:TetR family transcriptional regulator [Myxococcales bacterium]